MNSNRLDWLDKDSWTNGPALDEFDQPVRNILSSKVSKYDLYSALKASYYRDEEFVEAVEKIKKVYKILYPKKWREVEGKYYYKRDGKLVYFVPLYALNDLLDDFQEVKRLMFYL